MRSYQNFGRIIRNYRNKKGQNITEVAKALGVHRTYLSKLENGHIKPSIDLIEKLSNYFSLNNDVITELYVFGGYGKKGEKRVVQSEEEVNRMASNDELQGTPKQEAAAEINVPNNTSILYSDSMFVTTSDYGVVLDFAQRLGSTNKHVVISRIGVSREHAEAILKVLRENLDKHDQKKSAN